MVSWNSIYLDGYWCTLSRTGMCLEVSLCHWSWCLAEDTPVWPCPSWWSHWKLRQLRATVLQQLYTRPAHDSGCNRRHHWSLRQSKYYICAQRREQRGRYGLLKHTTTCRCLLYVIYKIITTNDVSVHTPITPIIENKYDL